MAQDEEKTGPSETLWKSPLPRRAVDDLNDPKESLNNPERNVDAVLVFDITPRDDVGADSTWDRLETSHSYEQRLQVLKCLHAKGLKLTQSLSLNQTQWIIRISAPSALLEETAERMGKKFQTQLKNSQEDTNRGLLPGYAEFRRDKRTEYAMVMAQRFSSVERQRIIHYLIEKALGGDGEDYAQIKRAENERLFHLFPTHDPRAQADLQRLWVDAWRDYQPLDEVRNYFGEEIAMYFAFLGQYTAWLIFPALLGALVTASQVKYGNDSDLLPLYCGAVAIWSILFLEFWKRYQAGLQLQWNVRDFESGEVNRIDFYGQPRVSPITGEDEIYFSDEERAWKYCFTYPVMALSILIVIVAALGVVIFQYYAVHSGDFGESGQVVAGLVNAVVIQVMNSLYASVAEWMNQHENHQTQTQYNDAKIMKVFIFQFVNSYAAVFYIAFLAGRVEVLGINLKCTRHGCMSDIHNIILCTLGLQMVVGNIMEVAMPYVQYKMEQNARLAEQEAHEGFAAGTGSSRSDEKSLLQSGIDAVNPWYDEDDELLQKPAIDDGFALPPYMSEHEMQVHMPTYDSTFEDYNELVIQFGYVVLFSMALPIGSLLCMFNNMIEIRSDAFKLVNVYQRPFYRGAQDIGTWYDILRVMVIMGVLFNCGMMAFTSNIFLRNHWVDPTKIGVVEMLVVVFVAEHIALTVMVFCADFIADEPPDLADEEERLRIKADGVLRTQDDEDKSRETKRIYEEMRQLIDEHDIALLEDIQIRKWRKQPQYGSGFLAGMEPPEEQDGENKGQPAKWLGERERELKKKQDAKEKMFEYELY